MDGHCAWDPYIKKQIKDIESRQVLFENEYSTTPGPVTKILNDLKWPTLQRRRKVPLLTMMFKVVSSL